MSNSITNKKNSIIIAALSCVIAALIMGFLIINATTPKTYPLGDSSKVTYIGKTSYGCWVVCDANPAEVYYYATDMSLADLVSYFKKATLIQSSDTHDGTLYFGLKTSSGETIYTNYYLKIESLYQKYPQFKHSAMTHAVAIPSDKYKVAQESI
jgi:hypothetical protein